MCPIAAGIDDDQFVSALRFAKLGAVGAGRDADGLLVDQGSAQGLAEGESRKNKREEAENRRFPKWECQGLIGISPLPPGLLES